MKPARFLLLATATGLLFNASCSSDASTQGPLGEGIPVSGPANTHCNNTTPVAVDPEACMTPQVVGEGGAPADMGASGTAGSDCNATHDAEYGETLYNSEGDDDDCKYHVAWTATQIHLNEDFTIT